MLAFQQKRRPDFLLVYSTSTPVLAGIFGRNMMVQVTELGYLGLSVSNPQAWREYAAEVVGLEVLDEGEGDRFYLRMDNWHHRFVLHVGDSTATKDDLEYIGWRVRDSVALEEMEAKLRDNGIAYRVGSPEEAAERRVLGLLKLIEPSGIPTEIFYGPQVDLHLPFHPGRRMHGKFVTGSHGLGHALTFTGDPVANFKFYSVLGLAGSIEYHLQTPAGVAKPVFMHCNERQHSIAFGNLPSEKRLNHLMLEYAELDDLGAVHDIVRRRGIDVALQLGKHSNDQALTFYSVTPSGWVMELGWGDKPATQQQYHLQDVFGHGIEASGFGLDVEL
jgi:2,3-dihydroxybiphenyl 1,2-dioxygenase